MQKLCQEILWDDDNSYAVQYAFWNQPRNNKGVIKAMCTATEQTYQETEKDINYFNVLDGLLMMGLFGSKFMCETVVLTQEMANLNDCRLPQKHCLAS